MNQRECLMVFRDAVDAVSDALGVASDGMNAHVEFSALPPELQHAYQQYRHDLKKLCEVGQLMAQASEQFVRHKIDAPTGENLATAFSDDDRRQLLDISDAARCNRLYLVRLRNRETGGEGTAFGFINDARNEWEYYPLLRINAASVQPI